MAIDTSDLITLSQKCSERINLLVGFKGSFIDDELYKLQRDIRNNLYEKLSKAFDSFIENYDYIESMEDLRNNLFEIINTNNITNKL
jgi:hypothetical protein